MAKIPEVAMTDHARKQFVDRLAPSLNGILGAGDWMKINQQIDTPLLEAARKEMEKEEPDYIPIDGGEHKYQVWLHPSVETMIEKKGVMLIKPDTFFSAGRYVVVTILDEEEFQNRRKRYLNRQGPLRNGIVISDDILERAKSRPEIDAIYETLLDKPWLAVRNNGVKELVGAETKEEIERVVNRWLEQGALMEDVTIIKKHDYRVVTMVKL